GQLVVGGWYDNAPTTPIPFVARWDGATWQFIDGLAGLESEFEWFGVHQLLVTPANLGSIGNQLIAVGTFGQINGVATTNSIAGWDGSAWHSMGASPTDYSIPGSIIVWDPDGTGPQPPELVQCFMDYTVTHGYSPRVAYWNGSSWMTIAQNEPDLI